MRGENRPEHMATVTSEGTSPRARGKRCAEGHVRVVFRNIPACAGKTKDINFWFSKHEEHPRVRGENSCDDGLWRAPPGTSPRARGKLRKRFRPETHRRNIPACAGKTCIHVQTRFWLGEHPRVRGENPRLSCPRLGRAGTSPRARGKQGGLRSRKSSIRNIPACAGKTQPF